MAEKNFDKLSNEFEEYAKVAETTFDDTNQVDENFVFNGNFATYFDYSDYSDD